jgi:hypothetical protein
MIKSNSKALKMNYIPSFIIIISLFAQCSASPYFLFDDLQIPIPSNTTTLPQDISFCIVDLKFNHGSLKICEFGEGLVSGFTGHEKLYGKNIIWANFWKYLIKKNIHTFYLHPNVECRCNDGRIHNHGLFKGIDNIVSCSKRLINGQRYGTYIYETKSTQNKKGLSQLIIPRNANDTVALQPFIQTHPSCIILDKHSRAFVLSKIATQLLFANDPQLSHYRPGCKIVLKKYNNNLAQEIITAIPSNTYVIKPINAWKGAGIIFTNAKDLDHHLKEIICNPTNYWKRDKSSCFLVETFEPSQTIEVRDGKYDATMRVAFAISLLDDHIDLEFLGAYWKLPNKTLDTKGKLEDLHKSHIRPKAISSAVVDKKTYTAVTSILQEMLPLVYLKMLAASKDPTFFKNLRAAIKADPSDVICN